MQKTTDYSLFKSFNSNREVSPLHVKQLARAITEKNMLHLNPILVDSNYNVVDGQHRLEAAKLVKAEIYFIMDDQVGKKDISKLNSVKKNWTTMDYINFHTIEKAPGFNVLSRFISEYPEIKISSVLTLLSSDGSRNSKEVQNGRVDVDNLEEAQRIAVLLKWIRNIYEHTYDNQFVKAVHLLASHPDFNEEVFKEKVMDQPRSLVKCISVRQYLEMLLEIYNYKLSRNRLEIRL